MRAKDKIFKGNHEALIDIKIFKLTQSILKGYKKSKGQIHYYPFRTTIRCNNCHYYLRGELQKGMVYYRCHTKEYHTKSIRQDFVEDIFKIYSSILLSLLMKLH